MAKDNKQEFVFKRNLINKLIAIGDEQPSALSLYLKILANASQRQRTFMGVDIERGQIAHKFKTERDFYKCSNKKFRKDRYLLVQKNLIDTIRNNGITIITVKDFDTILNQ